MAYVYIVTSHSNNDFDLANYVLVFPTHPLTPKLVELSLIDQRIIKQGVQALYSNVNDEHTKSRFKIKRRG